MKHCSLRRLLPVLAAALCLLLCSCSGGEDEAPAAAKDGTPCAQVNVLQFRRPEPDALTAVFVTDRGEFSAVLYPQAAPQAVQNFVTLARRGAYDGLPFHRVIADFIIQTGAADPAGGESIWGSGFSAECSDLLHHYTGALAMAGGNENHSQFYVVSCTPDSVSETQAEQMRQLGWSEEVITAYTQVGGAPALDNHYTVFGQLFYGMDAVRAIGRTAEEDSESPKEPAVLESVAITTFETWQADHPDAEPVFYQEAAESAAQ